MGGQWRNGKRYGAKKNLARMQFANQLLNGLFMLLMCIWFSVVLFYNKGLYPAFPFLLHETVSGTFIDGDNNQYGAENWKFTEIANKEDFWDWFQNRLLTGAFPVN